MTAQASTARFFDRPEERDAYLEGMYSYDREGYESTLAFVSARADELAREFLFWLETNRNGDPIPTALLRFEERRFGSALDPGPHGQLWYYVRLALRNGAPQIQHAKVPARHQGEGTLDYIERIARANGWLAAGKAEPAKRMPAKRRIA
jgi:hypothetical protein